nr:MAG TPA: SecA preprotein cross-linking domain [Caudoviricetes sp.]DAZ09109.1 MAG TPA: SecA preprotein cross-linking domain [Caudoviricetes sp.]
MGDRNNPRCNAEGYSDPTAFEALRNLEREDERFHRLLYTLFYLCELADFEIEGRIVLIDKKTGRIWR